MQTPAQSLAATSGRDLSLDLLRCVSIAAVVLMHCSSPLLSSTVKSDVQAGLLYSSLCLFCVPALLMISGAFLLRGDKEMDLRQFYGKRFVKIVAPLAAWSVIYYLLVCLQAGQTPHVISFFKRFLTGMWSGPLWFLYMIAGVYLMVPFLKPAFADASSPRGVVFVCITFGATALNLFTRLAWEMDLNRFFSATIISHYIGYFVLGHVLASRSVRVPGGRPVLAAVFLACAVGSAYGEGLVKSVEGMLPNTFYNFQQPLVVLMGVSVFLFFKGWNPALLGRHGKLVQEISSLTYGIFLSHVLALFVVTGQVPLFFAPGQGLDWNTISPWVGPLLTGLAVFVLSALLTAALKRIPLMARIVT